MVIEDLGRLGKGDYLFQMMPNRKLVRNYLYRGQLHSLRRLCIVDFQNDIDHTYDGAPPVDDPFDDDNDTTNAALGSMIIVVDFIMLILNIMLVVTCYCFIVSVRRKEVNLAIGFVVLAAVCLCINPCYWVIRLAMTPPWGYFNGVRIALTVIFLLLFWGVFFFAIVMAAKFFYFCFLVELDSTSPLVQQSDVDQKTMKRDIET
ncbi:Protein of unknown function [Gryllus bimaculatus]|nr:Protein of unknown function [Gryllus bimaculatus]